MAQFVRFLHHAELALVERHLEHAAVFKMIWRFWFDHISNKYAIICTQVKNGTVCSLSSSRRTCACWTSPRTSHAALLKMICRCWFDPKSNQYSIICTLIRERNPFSSRRTCWTSPWTIDTALQHVQEPTWNIYSLLSLSDPDLSLFKIHIGSRFVQKLYPTSVRKKETDAG